MTFIFSTLVTDSCSVWVNSAVYIYIYISHKIFENYADEIRHVMLTSFTVLSCKALIANTGVGCRSYSRNTRSVHTRVWITLIVVYRNITSSICYLSARGGSPFPNKGKINVFLPVFPPRRSPPPPPPPINPPLVWREVGKSPPSYANRRVASEL